MKLLLESGHSDINSRYLIRFNKAIGQVSATLTKDMEIIRAGASKAEKRVLRICLVLNLRGNRL